MTRTVHLQRHDGEGRGWLPEREPPTQVRTRRLQSGGLLVELLNEFGERIGEGVLQAKNGEWVGKCSEFKGWHNVRSKVGSGLLEFFE